MRRTRWAAAVLVPAALLISVSCAPPPAVPNRPPVAIIAASPIPASPTPWDFRFSAVDSLDPDGEVEEVAWDFGDGTHQVLGVEITHTYAQPGTYLVTVTVTDDDGRESATSSEVVVPVVDLSAPFPVDLVVDAPPIAAAGSGPWDRDFLREPGNVLEDPLTGRWICTYTGRGDTFNNLGAVISDDGVEWRAHPDNPISGSQNVGEDPYLVRGADGRLARDGQGRALMFTERKDYAFHLGIDLWRSAPGTLDGWTRVGQVVDHGPAGTWDGTDRTSPTVIRDGDDLVLLYEGRLLGPGGGAPDPNEGRIGIARSTDDGVTWVVGSAPIVEQGSSGWNERAIVPDDVSRVGPTWILLAHGQDRDGTWSVGRYATTQAPSEWTTGSFAELAGNPLTSASDTAMAWGDDPAHAMMVSGDGRRLERVAVVPR